MKSIEEVPNSLQIFITDGVIHETLARNQQEAGEHCSTCLIATALDHYYPVEGYMWVTRRNLSTLVRGDDLDTSDPAMLGPSWIHEAKTTALINYFDDLTINRDSSEKLTIEEMFTALRANNYSQGNHVLARL